MAQSAHVQGGGNAKAYFHAPSIRGHGKALHEDLVGAGGGDQNGIPSSLHRDFLIGLASEAAGSKGRFPFFVIDPEGESRNHAAGRKANLCSGFASQRCLVFKLHGPFGVGGRAMGFDATVDAGADHLKPHHSTSDRASPKSIVQFPGEFVLCQAPSPLRGVEFRRFDSIEGAAGDTIIDGPGIFLGDRFLGVGEPAA